MGNDFKIRILITDIRSDEGSVVVSLHKKSEKFPSDTSAIVSSERTKSQKGSMEIVLQNITAGLYAVAIHHDENDDGKMNYSFLGIPKEGFGFSNNKPVMFSAPSFESARVSISSDATISVRMKYF